MVEVSQKPYRYWYSAEQHRLFINYMHNGLEKSNVGLLPNGRWYTECGQSEEPAGSWPDYVLVGESERWGASMRPAKSVPIQDYRRDS